MFEVIYPSSSTLFFIFFQMKLLKFYIYIYSKLRKDSLIDIAWCCYSITQVIPYIFDKQSYMQFTKSKWVNSIVSIIGVNSLRLEVFHVWYMYFKNNEWFISYSIKMFSFLSLNFALSINLLEKIYFDKRYIFFTKIEIYCFFTMQK